MKKNDQLKGLKDRDYVTIVVTFANDNPPLTIHANTTREKRPFMFNGFEAVTILVEHFNATSLRISHQDSIIRVNKELLGK